MFLQAIVAWDKQIYRLYHQHHPSRPAGRHLTDPLWYLRHGWWRWPLRPVLLKVEIWAVPHLCRKNCNGNCICTPIHPDQLHMYTQVCALIQDSIIFTACTSHVHPFRQLNSYVHPFRQCKLHMYTQHVHFDYSKKGKYPMQKGKYPMQEGKYPMQKGKYPLKKPCRKGLVSDDRKNPGWWKRKS